MKNETPTPTHCDTSSVFVAVIGRPNVGKSSLTNLLVGEKVAIVTSKPQTTRTRITGVITRGPLQYVLLDTPGVHKARNKLGKRMDKTASDSIADVDVSMMLFEPYGVLNESEMVLVETLRRSGSPAIAVINKTDLVKQPADLEQRKAELAELGVFDAVYAVSVRANEHCEELFDILSRYAVESPHYFDDDAYTDLPEKELVAELIREKALLYLREEIPHGIAVVVERFKERPGTDLVDIDVNIYCERDSHKGMVIGKGGAMLKKIASAARTDCEAFLGCRVNLQCWVKVKPDWRDNEFLLNNFGFKQDRSGH
ncbi:MAG: GTPase Era [Faecalibacterium sp.]